VEGASREGQGHERGRDVQDHAIRQAQAKGLEATHQQSHIRQQRLRSQATQVRAVHQTHRSTFQEGARDPSRVEDDSEP